MRPIIIIPLMLLASLLAAEAREIDVGAGGQFSGIQDAVDAANPGDTIWVMSGDYHENVNIDKGINIYGWDTGEGDPVVDAGQIGSAITLSAGSDGSEVEGIRVTNSSDAGIMVLSNENFIDFVAAEGNFCGILIESSTGNRIWRNNVHDNYDRGIKLTASWDNDVQGNDLRNRNNRNSYDDARSQDTNKWDSNRYSGSGDESRHRIPGGASVDENPSSKKPNIPKISKHRHLAR